MRKDSLQDEDSRKSFQSNGEDSNNQKSKQKVQFLFVGNKAGLGGIDKERVAQVVEDASKNSEYFKRQLEKREKYDYKIQEMKQTIQNIKDDSYRYSQLQNEIPLILQEAEKQRIQNRVWAHFDIDMFYVACEMRDKPELKSKPCAVGGNSMISTANYVARQYGVRSGMPGFIAKKLCPELILLPHNFYKYKEAGDTFKRILSEYDNDLESMGLDEANLDLTYYLMMQGINYDSQEEIEQICKKIRETFYERTQLTASCGIAPNKMLAKICSDINKPNGQYFLENNRQKVQDFMVKMPIRKIPGIGNVSEQILLGLGIENCGQILQNLCDIKIVFSELSFNFFVKSALGIARAYHEEPEDRKSISVSRTFKILQSREEFVQKLKELSVLLAQDMQAYQKMGKSLCLSFKTHKFESKTKNMQLDRYIENENDIFKNSLKVLDECMPLDPLRLMGIRLTQLIDKSEYQKNSLERYFVKKNTLKSDENSSFMKEQEQNQKQNQNGNYLDEQDDDIEIIVNKQVQEQNELMSKRKIAFQKIQNKTNTIYEEIDEDDENDLEEIFKLIQSQNLKNLQNNNQQNNQNDQKENNQNRDNLLENQNEEENSSNQYENKIVIQKKESSDLNYLQSNIIQIQNNKKGQMQVETDYLENQNKQADIEKDRYENYQQEDSNSLSESIYQQIQEADKSSLTKINTTNFNNVKNQINQNNQKNQANQNNFKNQNNNSNQSQDNFNQKEYVAKEFTCPICNKVINCMSNIVRMNNHITKCIDEQAKQQQIQQNKEKIIQGENEKQRINSVPNNNQNKSQDKKRKLSQIPIKPEKKSTNGNQNGGLSNFFIKKN